MVSKIAAAHSKLDWEGSEYDYDDLACFLLEVVEKAGMLPPDPEIKSYYVFDEEVSEIIAKWEPENG